MAVELVLEGDVTTFQSVSKSERADWERRRRIR
jgi:hypothetical protein